MPSSPSAAEVDATLQVLGLQRGGYYVFSPGAEFGPAKRWPAFDCYVIDGC